MTTARSQSLTAIKSIPLKTVEVQAILAGRKTQMRIPMKVQPIDCSDFHKKTSPETEWRNEPMKLIQSESHAGQFYCEFCGNGHDYDGTCLFTAKYNVGDILWVRETFRPVTRINGTSFELVGSQYDYRADYRACIKGFDKWRPSIHMPQEAARIFLKITGIRVERLSDIIEADTIAEGVERIQPEPAFFGFKSYHVKDGKEQIAGCSPWVSFRTLWQSIHGFESWASNPWVFVYNFERCEKP